MNYSITVTGTGETSLTLTNISKKITDLRTSMTEVGTYLTNFYAREVFASRGGVIGQPWPALNSTYAAYKAKHYPGRPPLIRTGLMNRSFRSFPAQLSVTIRNEAPYFPYHQRGEGVPKRVMMAIDNTRARAVVNIIDAQVARIMAAS